MKHIILAVFVLSASVFGQPIQRQPANQKSSSVDLSSSASASGSETATEQVLKAQLQTMKDYDQRLLATVFWSLGVVFALALGLAGFGWYTNNRIYERDLRSLKNDLSTEISQATDRLTRINQEAFSKFSEALGNSEKQFSSSHQQMMTDVGKLADQACAKAVKTNSSSLQDLRRELLNLRRVTFNFQADSLESDGSYTYALSVWSDYLETVCDLERQFYWAGAGLTGIQNCLERGVRPGEMVRAGLHKVLDRMTPEHLQQVEIIRSLIRKSLESTEAPVSS